MSVQQSVNDLARLLGRPVLLEDRRQRVVAYSPQLEPVDDVRRRTILEHSAGPAVTAWLTGLGVGSARGPVHIPSNADFGMLPRLCLPVWRSAQPLGYLWIVEEPDRIAAGLLERAGGLLDALAEEMYRQRQHRDEVSARLEDRARELLLGTPATRTAAAEELRALERFPGGVGVRAVVLRPGSSQRPADPEALQRTLRAFGRAAGSAAGLGLVRGHHLVVLVPGGMPTQPIARLLLRFGEEHGVCPADGGATTGIGGVRSDLAEARKSYLEARRAARIAARFELPDPVADWDSLGPYRAIDALRRSGLRPDEISPGFAALRELRDGPSLIATAECYLAVGGRAQEAAARLMLHRTTLYHRIERIERTAGVVLQDGIDRFGLHAAILLDRLEGR